METNQGGTMKGFRVWSNYWKKYATEAELYMDGSADAVFEDDGGVPHHENADLVLEFDTGLKDKNGKEIYEGDIVAYDYGFGTYVVAYRRYDASFVLEDDDREEVLNLVLSGHPFYEVIGNVHENSKLLEEEECES